MRRCVMWITRRFSDAARRAECCCCWSVLCGWVVRISVARGRWEVPIRNLRRRAIFIAVILIRMLRAMDILCVTRNFQLLNFVLIYLMIIFVGNSNDFEIMVLFVCIKEYYANK